MYPYIEAKTSKRKPKIHHLEVSTSHQGHALVTHHYSDGTTDDKPHILHTPDSFLEHVTKHMGIKWGEVEREEDEPNEEEYKA